MSFSSCWRAAHDALKNEKKFWQGTSKTDYSNSKLDNETKQQAFKQLHRKF